MRFRSRVAFSGFALVALVCPARAERLPITTYTTANGLACNQVNAVAQDRRGFLWIATDDGLSRFDGRTFQTFTRADGLPDERINAVAETASGELWIGTHRGLSFLSGSPGERFQTLPLGSSSGSDLIRDLAPSDDGTLWAATSDGLYAVRSSRKVERVDLSAVFAPTEPQVVRSLHAAAGGGVWCGATQLAFEVDRDGRVSHVVRLPTWDTVNAITEAPEGTLWLATRDGVRRVVGASGDAPAISFVLESKPPHDRLWINHVATTRDAHVWASGSWVSEIDPTVEPPRVLRRYGPENGLCSGGIASIFEDRDGAVWAAMQSCGLVRIARDGAITFDESDGIGTVGIASFFEDATGTVCASEVNRVDLWHCFDGSRFSDVSPRDVAKIPYLGWSWNQTVVHDRTGGWWIAAGGRLVRYASEQHAAVLAERPPSDTFANEPLLADADIFRVFEDSRGDVWVGRLGHHPGVVRWDRATGTFHDVVLADAGAWQAPSAFAEDRHGIVWIGFYQGELRRVEGDRLVRVPLPPERDPESIPSMLFDPEGRLWIATGEAGLWRIDDPAQPSAVRIYDRARGLASDRLLSMAEGADGSIYVGSRSGVSVVDPATDRVRLYGVADGLKSDVINTIFRDTRGRLWFGTFEGISMLAPPLRRDSAPPQVFVTGLSVEGVERPVSPRGATQLDGIELGAGASTIQIRAGAPGFVPGARPRLEYRLDGDADWSPAADQTVLTLAHLAPGSYRASVRAVLPGRTAAGPAATVAFRVAAPFWRSGWFLGACVVLAGTGIWWGARARVRRLVALERMRTRIAMDLHDDVGSSLSQIALQGELAVARLERGEGDPRSVLERMAESARTVVDSMSDVVWSVDPKHDVLSDLARRIRSFALATPSPEGLAIRLDLQAPERDLPLDANVRRQIYLVFKESFSNALRHAAASHLAVTLRAADGAVELVVADDGRGLPGDGGAANGHGLASMQRRAASCGGRFELEATPGGGTTVRLVVPAA